MRGEVDQFILEGFNGAHESRPALEGFDGILGIFCSLFLLDDAVIRGPCIAEERDDILDLRRLRAVLACFEEFLRLGDEGSFTVLLV